MSVGELFGFLGGIIGVVIAVPQVRRVRSLGHGRGVSIPTWVLTFLVSAAWLGWGLRVGSPSAIASNFVAGLLNATVVASLLGRRRATMPALLAAAAVAIGLAQLLPEALLSAVLVALTVSRLPQVKQSWDNRRSPHESAVSLGSLAVAVVSMLCWEAYALLEQRYLVNLTSTIAITLVLAIAWIEARAPRVATRSN